MQDSLLGGNRASSNWASGEAVCCGDGQEAGEADVDRFEAAAGVLQERTAMILGMNSRALRARRRWSMYIWRQKRHWALVLQPFGEVFTARIVDDFVHNAQHCFSEEVPSSQLFLVYELLLDHAEPFLMLSVKPDFQLDRRSVFSLGVSERMTLLDLQNHALQAFGRFRCYSFIGANCQHFAADMASGLGARTRINPDDETIALAATDTALPVGVVGACVAATAAAGAASAVWAPVALNVIAASASAVSLIGCATLAGVAGLYRMLHDQSRQGSPVARGAQLLFAQSASVCLSSAGSRLLSKSMPCLRSFGASSDSEDEELDGLERHVTADPHWLASALSAVSDEDCTV